MIPAQAELLKKILPLYAQSYEWLLEDVKTRADELNPGNYSDELNLAIECDRLMQKVQK